MSLRMCENQYNATRGKENLLQNYKKEHICFSVNQNQYFRTYTKLKPTIKLTVNINNNSSLCL